MQLCGLSRSVSTTRTRNGGWWVKSAGWYYIFLAATFTFSQSVLTDIGRQDGEWVYVLKYVRDDVHNFKMSKTEYLCGGGITSASKRVRARFSKPDTVCLNFKGLGTCIPAMGN